MVKTILEIIGKVFEFIYDFLFNWEDDPYEDEKFLEEEKSKHALVKAENKNINGIKQEYELISDAFGKRAADYLYSLKQEVNFLVGKHNLIKENTIRVVIPPEKLEPGNIKSGIFEEIIEGIYSQYNKDVILKPGKINIVGTSSGKVFAEMEIESYSVNEELLNIV